MDYPVSKDACGKGHSNFVPVYRNNLTCSPGTSLLLSDRLTFFRNFKQIAGGVMKSILSTSLTFFLFLFSAIYASGEKEIKSRSPVIIGDIVNMDINNIYLPLENDGSTGNDARAYYPNPGLPIPPGYNLSFLFQGGLAATGYVNGELRASWMAKASLIQEWQPGEWGMDPSDPLAKFYEVSIEDGPGSPAYIAWADAVSLGSEFIDLNGDGIYDPYVDRPALSGDRTAWIVYNDGTPMSIRMLSLQTPPMGLEILQTAWAYEQGEDLKDVIFFRFQLINVSPDNIDDFIFSVWLDPDIGESTDDLVGCDTTIEFGYIYNNGTDPTYQANPPAFGVKLLQGMLINSPGDTAYVFRGPGAGMDTILDKKVLPWTSFVFYNNDPAGTTQFPSPGNNAQLARLYQEGGSDGQGNIIYPPNYGAGGLPTDPPEFIFCGDPVSGTGWIDNDERDRRFLVNCGPLQFAAGDTQDIVFIYALGQGTDPLNSIDILRQRVLFTSDFFPYGRILSISVNETLNSVDSTFVFRPSLSALVYSDTIQSVNWLLIQQPPGSSAQLIPGAGFEVTLDPDLPGTYAVQLQAIITGGEVLTATRSIEAVDNHPPVASLTIIPSQLTFGDSAIADASGSSDPDNDTLHFNWNFPGWVTVTPEDTSIVGFIPLHAGSASIDVTVNDPYFFDQASDSFIVTPLANGLEFINSIENIGNVLKYHNGLLYVASGGSFSIIDPNTLVVLGTSTIVLQKFDTDGTFVAVASYQEVVIYEIDPNYQLVEKSIINLAVPFYYGDIYLKFPYLFIPDNNPLELKVYNISNPTLPTLMSSYSLPILTRDVAFNGDFAAISSNLVGIVTLDIFNPANIVALDSLLSFPPASRNIEYAGNEIYVLNGLTEADEVQVIDAFQPANLQLAGSFTVEPIIAGTTDKPIREIFGKENFLFVGTMDGIKIYDVSDLNNPYERVNYHAGLPVSSMAWNNPYLYTGSVTVLYSEVLHVFGYDSTFVMSIDEEKIISEGPESFQLFQNYPNPFNPTTTIKYDLPKPAKVVLKIYNILGQEVRTLVDARETAGYKSVVWDGRNNAGASVASGVYFYRIAAENFSKVRKMLIIR